MGELEIRSVSDIDLMVARIEKATSLPAAYRGKPADLFSAILWGHEIGLSPMKAISYIDVIEGNPTLNAEGRGYLIRKAGHSLKVDANGQRAIITGIRRDTGESMTVTYSLDDAKKAGLLAKSVWQKYSSDMLYARALTQLSRRLFQDIIGGLSYDPDKAYEIAEKEAVAPAAAPPPSLAQALKKKQEPTVQKVIETEIIEADVIIDPVVIEADEVKEVTPEDRKAFLLAQMATMFAEAKIKTAADKMGYCSNISRRQIKKSIDLTIDEIDAIIDALDADLLRGA